MWRERGEISDTRLTQDGDIGRRGSSGGGRQGVNEIHSLTGGNPGGNDGHGRNMGFSDHAAHLDPRALCTLRVMYSEVCKGVWSTNIT